jgi:hypothetical protein
MDPATMFAGASLLGSLFGGNDQEAQPERRSETTGYNALPPEAQRAYQQYFSMLNNLGQNPYDQRRMGFAQKPNDIFGSQELYNLQQTQPNQGVRPIGVQEPFNQVQRNAFDMYAKPDYSQAGLSQYLQPFEAARNRALESINRGTMGAHSDVADRSSQMGNLGRNGAIDRQAPAIEEARARAIADMEGGFGEKALGLREMSLANMLGAGNAIQGHNQAGLEAASGKGLAMSNPAFGRALAYMQLLAGLPNAGQSSSVGAIASQPSPFKMAGNIGLAGFGQHLGANSNNNSGGGWWSNMFGNNLGGRK